MVPFSSQKTPTSAKTQKKFSPTFDALERRDAMSVTPTLYYGSLRLEGSAGNDTIAVRQVSNNFVISAEGRDVAAFAISDVRKIEIEGKAGDDIIINNSSFPIVVRGGEGVDRITGGSGNDVLMGDGGADIIDGGAGDDYLFGDADGDTLRGGTGNDVIYGNAGNDYIFGGDGDDILQGREDNDVIYGDAGNDVLYGNAGYDRLEGGIGDDRLYGGFNYDYLYGNDGNDYLDGEQDGAYLNGGRGIDMDASKVAPKGQSANDVVQGGLGDCWFLAPLSSVAGSRTKLTGSDRIHRVDQNLYEVKLYNVETNVWQWVPVRFDGTTTAADAKLPPAAGCETDTPACEGAYWAIIYQRAMVTMRGGDYTDLQTLNNMTIKYGSGQGFQFVTGRTFDFWVTGYDGFTFDNLKANLRAGKLVAAATKPSDVASTLVTNHVYSVLSVNSATKMITLRNPHGGEKNGVLEISWDDFAKNFNNFCRMN
jgi:Ca2+-binding RTX toxin-like protein